MTEPPAQPPAPAPAPPGVTWWRPKPAVEAIQLAAGCDWAAIAAWCGGDGDPGHPGPLGPYPGSVLIRTAAPGSERVAMAGDWIVRGVEARGELPFWVMSAEGFAAEYEPADEPVPEIAGTVVHRIVLAESAPAALPFPPGIYGRAELPGFRSHVGWATDGVIGGQPCLVMSDRDGTVLGEYILGPASRFVRLAVPDPVVPGPRQEAITQDGTWYDDGWPDNDDETNPL